MKPVRLFSIVMAVVMLAIAVFPFATQGAAAQGNVIALNAPTQSFMDAAHGLPLLAPMSASVPFITIGVESAGLPDYACTLVNQSPKDWTRMRSRQYFDMAWTVKNTGKRVWATSTVDLKYLSGVKMQTHGDVFDVPAMTSSGHNIKLIVDMVAPKALGYYTSYWSLVTGNRVFCRLSISVYVNRH